MVFIIQSYKFRLYYYLLSEVFFTTRVPFREFYQVCVFKRFVRYGNGLFLNRSVLHLNSVLLSEFLRLYLVVSFRCAGRRSRRTDDGNVFAKDTHNSVRLLSSESNPHSCSASL